MAENKDFEFFFETVTHFNNKKKMGRGSPYILAFTPDWKQNAFN
jgi:hypothetical protein